MLVLAGCSQKDNASATLEHPEEWHCVMEHFQEAIQLNEERKAQYSALTAGASEDVSDALLDFERFLANSTAFSLPILRHYWAKRIPVLCKGFVPIAETPAFVPQFAQAMPAGKTEFVNPYALAWRLTWSYLVDGREGLIEKGRSEIGQLQKPDHQQCLVKHFLESIVYSAEVADEVNAEAKEAGSFGTHWISFLSIQSQIFYLIPSSRIDKMAEAVHDQGIPILCNDVPVILKDLAH